MRPQHNAEVAPTPADRPGDDRRIPFAVWAVCIAAVLAAWWIHLGHSTDDGFITYRYARNLAEGRGLVFNPGESWLGTSAPGWAIVLGALGRIAGSESIPWLSGLLAVACGAVTCLRLAAAIAPRGFQTQSAVAATLLLGSSRWLLEVLGHEGYAVAAAALAALLMSQRGRSSLAGACWSVAAWLRPDAAVMGVIAGAQEWRRRRRFPWALVATGTAVGAAGLGLVWLLTGGCLLPASLAVKMAEARTPTLALDQPAFLVAAAGWLWRCLGWAAAPAVALALAGWIAALRSQRDRAIDLLLPVLGMAAFYPLLGLNFAPWYWVVPGLWAIAGAGAAIGLALRRSRFTAAVAGACVVAAALPGLIWQARLGASPPDGRMAHMVAAADWITGDGARPDDLVAAVEVGFLGFALEQPVLDLVGLGSPGSLAALVEGRSADLVLEQRPTYLVYNPAFGYLLGRLFSAADFRSDWRRAFVVPPTSNHVTRVEVWRRLRPEPGSVRD